MARGRDPNRFTMLTVAYLLGKEQRKQRDVADILHLTPSYVSKLRNRAIKDRYLVEDIRFVPQDLSAVELHEIEARAKPNVLTQQLAELAARTRVPAPRVHVFGDTVEVATGREPWSKRLETFGNAAAAYLPATFMRSTACGVAWGETVSAVVRGLEHLKRPTPWTARPIFFIPVAGEAIGKGPAATSASTLAQRLDEIVNGGHGSSFSLGALPALIPRGFSRDEEEVIAKLFRTVRPYRDVFGGRGLRRSGRPPWIERIDMLLTSVGPLEYPLGYGGSELLQAADVDAAELRTMIAGDVAGVLLPRPELDSNARQRLADIARRWRGIRSEHVKRCAQRAQRGRPGTVIVAIGANKAATVCEAVRHGMVNHLLVDGDLARALQRLLAGGGGRPAAPNRR